MSEKATLDEFTNTESGGRSEENRITGFGTFPIEWDKKDIVDCAEIRDSERIPLNSKERKEKKPGDIPYYGANGVLDYIDEHIFDSELILLAEDGGHFEEYQERPIAYRISGKSWVNNHAHILEARDGIVTDYLFYSLEHRNLVPYVSGSTRSKLTQSMLRKVKIPSPPLPEQRQIANVLYTVDRAIKKTEEVITQTERLREGVMQDLFSRGVRSYDDFQETKYGTIPASWEVKPVREIADRIGSGGTPNTDKEEYYGGEIEWVKTDDLNSGLVESAKTSITSQGLDESAAKLFPEGTVVFAMYGGALGQNGRLGMEAAMNQACCGIVNDESEMNSYLLHQQLIHRKKQLTALSAGTHQQNISQSMIEKFEVFVPPLDEQKEMVNILKSIERTIEANTNEKERLKRLKRGLMQDLLSGTVRTTDTNIEVPEEIAQYG